MSKPYKKESTTLTYLCRILKLQNETGKNLANLIVNI